MIDNSLPPVRRMGRPLLAAALVASAAAVPTETLAAVKFAAGSLLGVAPYIALGVLLTAVAVASGSAGAMARAFRGREPAMIVWASLVGAVTPVCGITVLPLVAGLLAAGVPLSPVMAFWLASPITDPGMFTVTAGLLGWPFAVAKTAAAVAIGLASGAATFFLARTATFAEPLRRRPELAQTCGCGPEGLRLAFWRDAGRLGAFHATCRQTGWLMVKWLALAFVAEYVLRRLLPLEAVVSFVSGNGIGAVALAAAVGAPVYLDGYAALPLVRALLDSGMGPGPALAFLIAGGIISAWAAIPVYALTRPPVFIAYLAMAVAGAFLSGLVFGWIIG